MLFPNLILLASSVFTATNALVLSTTETTISPSAAPTILQRGATTSAPSALSSPVYFLTTNYVTITGMTNAYVTLPVKTISFAVPTCIQTLTPDKNGHYLLAYNFFIVAASTWGLTAFILRVFSTHNQQDTVLELLSSILALTISPFINFYHCILLGRLVHHYLTNRSLLGIRAQFLALPFLVLNVAALVLEVVGAAMMDKRNLEWEQRNADYVYIGGLLVQMLINFLFIGMLVAFWFEMSGSGRSVTGTRWKGLVGAMFGASGLILIQIFSSLAKSSVGDKSSGALSSHESYFYGLEITPIVLAIATLNVFHPGRFMTGEERMESLWSILMSFLPCCRSRHEARKIKNKASVASSKELVGSDEQSEYEKNHESPRYSPL